MRRERAAALRHHAQSTEDEDFGLAIDGACDCCDFRNRKDARQHDALHAEMTDIQSDRIGIGSGGLHRKMQALRGMGARGVIDQANVGDNQRVCAGRDRVVDGAVSKRLGAGCRKRVDGHQNLGAAAMGIGNSLTQLAAIEIQARKVSRIGRVGIAAI
jgi:hypothetical protein